jgi:tetratricopeptide (TPR) repeat protein
MSLDYGDEATPETILLIADTGGSHRIEVLAGSGVPAGRYSIRAVAARVATESDAAWVAARRNLEDGIRQIGTLPPSAWGPLVESFQAALAGFRHVADRDGEARALYQLAFAAEGMRRPDARERAEEALALYTDLGDPNGMGKAEFELATLHDRLGEMPAARAASERSLELFRRASNRTIRRTWASPSAAFSIPTRRSGWCGPRGTWCAT